MITSILRFKYDKDPLADSDTETYRYRSVKPFIHFPNHARLTVTFYALAEDVGSWLRKHSA